MHVDAGNFVSRGIERQGLLEMAQGVVCAPQVGQGQAQEEVYFEALRKSLV
ncbi:MAG: hypothetical protein WA228_10145 [Desulfobaccales bacterium]